MDSSRANSNDTHSESTIIAIAVVVAVPVTFLNLFTTVMMFASKRLRAATNYPTASFLFGSVIQSLLVLPIYIYKQMTEPNSIKPLVCDLYRFPYFYSQHIMKVSLLVVSFDRLIVIKYPFRYQSILTKCSVTFLLLVLWVVTLLIDLIPFLINIGNDTGRKKCTFLPTYEWGLSVIILFDVSPFIVITVNYVTLWKVAVSIKRSDEKLYAVVQPRTNHTQVHHPDPDDECNGVGSNNKSHNCSGEERSYCCIGEDSDNRSKTIALSGLPVIKANDGSVCGNIFAIHNEVLTTMNTHKEINKTKHSNRKQHHGDKLSFFWEMKATKTAVLFCLIYLVCWGPLGIFYMIDHLCNTCMSQSSSVFLTDVKRVIKFASLSSSIFLPFVYCWRSKEFRDEVIRMFCKRMHYKRKQRMAYDSSCGPN